MPFRFGELFSELKPGPKKCPHGVVGEKPMECNLCQGAPAPYFEEIVTPERQAEIFRDFDRLFELVKASHLKASIHESFEEGESMYDECRDIVEIRGLYDKYGLRFDLTMGLMILDKLCSEVYTSDDSDAKYVNYEEYIRWEMKPVLEALKKEFENGQEQWKKFHVWEKHVEEFERNKESR